MLTVKFGSRLSKNRHYITDTIQVVVPEALLDCLFATNQSLNFVFKAKKV